MSAAAAPVALVQEGAARIPPWLTLLLATSCGLIAANIYLAQPLVGHISASLDLSPGAGGLIPTMAQFGYGVGLLLVAPLGDLIENRRLVLSILCFAILALAGAALSTHAAAFLGATLLIGLGSVAVQVLVPYAAHLAPDATRGRIVGNVMSDLMLGIMLARPMASFITKALSWHAVFALSAALMAALAAVLLDFGVTASGVLGQRAIYQLGAGSVAGSTASTWRPTSLGVPLGRRLAAGATSVAAGPSRCGPGLACQCWPWPAS